MIRHVPLAVPAALVAGLVVGSQVLPVVPLAVLSCASLVGAVVAVRASRRSGAATLAIALLCTGCGLGGAAWASARVAATAPVPVHRFGAATGIVTVTTLPSATPRGTRMRVQAGSMTGPGAPPVGTALLMDLPRAVAPPQVGAVVRVSGSTAPASRAGSPAWWVRWVRRQGVSARIRATRWAAVGWRAGAAGMRDALRRWAQRNVAAGLSGDRRAMVRGMALGGGDGLSDDAATSMRDAGLWHLLAVSGQNVAVIGIGVVAALGALGMARTRRVVTAGAAMLVYCLACDGGASVMRAGLMGAIGVAADLRGGRRAPWNALLVALAAMLALDPLSVGDPGLQLSFAAVAGLFAISPPVCEWLRGLMPGRVADLVGQSAGAGLATAPVLAAGFGSISVVGLLANLVAVPVAGPVVVAAMLGVAGNALWHPLGVLLAWVAALGAGVILAVARLAAAIPGAVQQVPSWGAVPLALLAAAPPALWWWLRRVPAVPVRRTAAARQQRPARAFVPRGAAARVAVVAGAAMVLVVLLAPGCGSPALAPGAAIRMLDVGQGSSVALRRGAEVEVLVDAGPPGDPAPVIAALERMDAPWVGVLVVSHGSADHAGGAADVLDRLPVGRVVLPAPDRDAPLVRDIARRAAAAGVPVEWGAAGMALRTRAWRAAVIGPAPEAARSPEPNQRCLVVSARAAGLSALIPGDAESPSLSGIALDRMDVLQVPHHGSEDPGLAGVLERLRPSVAMVSAGEGNPYGHPRGGTLAALGAAGARVARTDRGGDIDVRPEGDGIIVARG